MRNVITTLLLVIMGTFSIVISMGCEPCDPETDPEQCQYDDPNPEPTPTTNPDPDPVQDEEPHVNAFDLDRAYGWLEGSDVMSDKAGDADAICSEIDSYVLNEVKSDEWLEIQCTTQGLVFGDSEDGGPVVIRIEPLDGKPVGVVDFGW